MEASTKVLDSLNEEPSEVSSFFDRHIREEGRGYYKMSGGKNPNFITISNFKLRADARIRHGNEWYFMCTAINGSGQIYENIILARRDFQGSSSLKQALSFHSDLEYYGNNRDTTEIQGLLTEQNPPEKAGTDTNGIHWTGRKWVYVERDTIIDKDGINDDIVYLNTHTDELYQPRILAKPDIDRSQLRDIAYYLRKFNDGSIAYLIIGWIGFCLLKERLSGKVNRHNPILLCQGEPGSGKTETISGIIQPIFSVSNSITNIADATKFTFAIKGSQSNLVPCFYDEWKWSVMQRSQIKNMDSMLLAVFNQTVLPRGRTGYEFSSPLVISGEMALDSASIKHRTVEAFFTQDKSHAHTDDYKRLRDLPLASFGKGFLQHMLGLSDSKIYTAFDEQVAAVDPELDDRFQENAALTRTGLWLIMDYFKANGISVDEYNEGFAYIDNAIKETMSVGRITNVDKIISDFSIMSNSPNCSGNWLKYGSHYDIKGSVLRIRIAEAYAVYEKYARSHKTQAEVISKTSFLQQLQTKSYYIDKKTVRIGVQPCNAIRLDLSEMPEYIDANFLA